MNIPLINQTIVDMTTCFQTPTQNVLEHGYAVRRYANRFFQFVYGDDDLNTEGLRLPEWLIRYGKPIIKGIPYMTGFLQYLKFHDCGKPYCRILDENGKQHFPNHEKVSYQRWLEIDGEGYIAQCILHDMDMHRMKTADIPDFIKLPEMPSLLLSSLAEIHANAEMFGGIDSDGFKIKFAQIQRRGNTACHLFYNGD